MVPGALRMIGRYDPTLYFVALDVTLRLFRHTTLQFREFHGHIPSLAPSSRRHLLIAQ